MSTRHELNQDICESNDDGVMNESPHHKMSVSCYIFKPKWSSKVISCQLLHTPSPHVGGGTAGAFGATPGCGTAPRGPPSAGGGAGFAPGFGKTAAWRA